MVDSVSNIANLGIRMSAQHTALEVNVAVHNKVQDQQDAEGEAVIKLIESSSATEGGVDVYV